MSDNKCTSDSSSDKAAETTYNYEYVSGALPEDYMCAICTFVARDPHQVGCCGGLFCKECLQKVEDTSDQPLCPLCRKDLVKKYFKDWRAERYINNLKIYCTNKSVGCTWDGPMNELEKHLGNCGCETVNCSDCEEELMRKFLESHHANHCPEREVSCPNCKEVGAYSFITSDEHIDECPDIVVPCPNEGCGKEMYRKLLQAHTKICPKEIISCSYSIAGCCVMTTREAVMEHEHQFTQEHLHMALEHMRQQDAEIKALKQEQTSHTCTFFVEEFQVKRKEQSFYYSPCFYMPPNVGYKMQVEVTFSNCDHMGVFVYLEQGRYDNVLEWPFRGEVTIELLNQLDDKDHEEHIITFDDSIPVDVSGQCMASTSNCGWGEPKFISYSDLSAAYLQNDTVFFRVKVAIHSKVKSWLNCRLLTNKH